MLIGACLNRDNRAVSVAERVDCSRSDTSTGRAARDHDRIHLVKSEIAGKWGLKKYAWHAFGKLEVIAIYFAARIVLVPLTIVFDVLQTVLGIRARTPYACICCVVFESYAAPNHRHAALPRHPADRVDIFDLTRIGFICGFEHVGARIGLLNININDCQPLAKAEFLARRIGHNRVKKFACCLAIFDHFCTD